MNVNIKLSESSNMLLKMDTEDIDYVKLMKENFTAYVEGFQYMPAYRSGNWSGKICMINNNTLSYGLLFDFIRFHKKNFPRNKLIIDDNVKQIFKGPNLKPKYNLKLKPYLYQKDCIESSLAYSKGIIRSATASGKCSKDIEIEIELPDELYNERFSDFENLDK